MSPTSRKAVSWSVVTVPVSDRDAVELLRVHFAEMVGRYTGRVAEIKRMFVRVGLRGLGGGSLLLGAAEDTARELGATAVRLDTRRDLVEARALYAEHGYRETAPHSVSVYADHWFTKSLG